MLRTRHLRAPTTIRAFQTFSLDRGVEAFELSINDAGRAAPSGFFQTNAERPGGAGSSTRQPTMSVTLRCAMKYGRDDTGSVSGDLPAPLVEVERTCPGGVKDDRH
jgi:hypothetical protein